MAKFLSKFPYARRDPDYHQKSNQLLLAAHFIDVKTFFLRFFIQGTFFTFLTFFLFFQRFLFLKTFIENTI